MLLNRSKMTHRLQGVVSDGCPCARSATTHVRERERAESVPDSRACTCSTASRGRGAFDQSVPAAPRLLLRGPCRCHSRGRAKAGARPRKTRGVAYHRRRGFPSGARIRAAHREETGAGMPPTVAAQAWLVNASGPVPCRSSGVLRESVGSVCPTSHTRAESSPMCVCVWFRARRLCWMWPAALVTTTSIGGRRVGAFDTTPCVPACVAFRRRPTRRLLRGASAISWPQTVRVFVCAGVVRIHPSASPASAAVEGILSSLFSLAWGLAPSLKSRNLVASEGTVGRAKQQSVPGPERAHEGGGEIVASVPGAPFRRHGEEVWTLLRSAPS